MSNATLKRLWNEDEAANAVEYGLITAVIAVVLIALMIAFRGQITALFGRIGRAITQANNS
jgi:Flp pilus assembly pilin Flp